MLAALIGKGEVTIVWGYTGSPASWKSYKPGPPATGTLLSMNDGYGYWIYMTTPDTLFVSGAVIPPASTSPAYPLNKGWNLIGFKPQPTVQSESVNQYLSSISGEYDQNSVWVYDNSSGSWTRADASYMLEPGQGMWILTTVAVTLVP